MWKTEDEDFYDKMSTEIIAIIVLNVGQTQFYVSHKIVFIFNII